MHRAKTVQSEFNSTYARDPAKAFDDLTKAYRDAAKNGMLTTTEAVVLQYILFAPDADFARYRLACLLLRVLPEDRLAQHNWDVAPQIERGHLLQVGATIDKLALPLYPFVEGLDVFNAKLLQSAREGGGESPKNNVFATRNTIGSCVEGGGTLPVALLPDGTYGVDVGCVEDACNSLQQQINSLLQQKRALRSRLPQVPIVRVVSWESVMIWGRESSN